MLAINFENASMIINNLDPNKCMIKIGSVAFNSIGHKVIKYAAEKGFDVFLDLKLHDIPNTVKKSIQGLVSLPINMITIHVSGGKEMMKAAMDAVSGTKIKVFGVTALTSLSDEDTNGIRLSDSNDDQKRVMKPIEAINLGADYLVIGRPITKSNNISETLDKIFLSIK